MDSERLFMHVAFRPVERNWIYIDPYGILWNVESVAQEPAIPCAGSTEEMAPSNMQLSSAVQW